MIKKPTKSRFVITGLLHYLSETGQSNLLPQVRESLDTMVDKSKKGDSIIVTSYVPLSSVQKKRLQRFVWGVLGRTLPVANHIDKTLIGGFTIKVGDWFVDDSLLNTLGALKQSIMT